MNDSYYNTTNKKDADLKKSTRKATGQAAEILAWFKRNQKGSPSQCWESLYGGDMVPITSVRRAISVLTNKKKELVKTSEKIMGSYGEPEHIWRIPIRQFKDENGQVKMAL